MDQTSCVPIRSSVPVAPWEASAVTVLGDAVHAMSPAQGSGANCALLDAALPCRTLRAAVSSGASLTAAIGEYERRMTEYGFAAVRASERAASSLGGGPLGRVLRRIGRLSRWPCPGTHPAVSRSPMRTARSYSEGFRDEKGGLGRVPSPPVGFRPVPVADGAHPVGLRVRREAGRVS
ncbi:MULTISPECIES: NAD(P)/FAD-dependent oxidoreductase, partial [unclassified Microbispora]|uniref:FAD-dependent oxidoreductase n=1 Tax=unclassified Microbispora TaxID=2614687 RepID=UPI00163BC9A2